MTAVTLEESCTAFLKCVFNNMMPEQAFRDDSKVGQKKQAENIKPEALIMLRGGMSCNRISKELGVPPSTVKYWRKQISGK